jgi:hypothetical protein
MFSKPRPASLFSAVCDKINLGSTVTGGKPPPLFAGSLVMAQSRVVALAAVALVGTAAAAHAGPCTAQIAEVERYLGRLALGPTASQSIGAQLHHQPTPQSVERSLSTARADAEAALDRARKADAEGNAAACTKALDEAKLIYLLE